jgi:hypothetical protein
MENEEFEERIRANRKERAASLRGLRRLYVFVDEGESRVSFSDQYGEQESFCKIIRASDPESEKRMEQMHRERMESFRFAFPIVGSKLHETGIERIPGKEWLENPGLPRLVLAIDLGKAKKGASFSIRTHLEQAVLLERDPNVRLTLKTWEGRISKRKFKYDGINWSLGQAVDYFLHSYRIANDLEDQRDQLSLVF